MYRGPYKAGVFTAEKTIELELLEASADDYREWLSPYGITEVHWGAKSTNCERNASFNT